MYKPRSGGKGGSLGNRMCPTILPPATALMNTIVIPNMFPPGRHSFSVMDHNTPNSTAAMATEREIWNQQGTHLFVPLFILLDQTFHINLNSIV